MEREKFGDLNVYFNFDNHAKLIMTDKIAYIGSQNFSDASQKNFELGFLVNDSLSIHHINNHIFEEIKSKSILYATSEYAEIMKYIADIMRDTLQSIRQDIFSLVGDEPYIPEIEVFDVQKAHFNREKWKKFKELQGTFKSIVIELINGYPSEFNKRAAVVQVNCLGKLVKYFTSELDELANFTTNIEDSMMWSKFRQLDRGDDLDEALEEATDFVRDYKQDKFYEIETRGNDLVKTFDDIEECIKAIETSIENIKDAMIKKSVYKNLEIIKNYTV